MLARVNVSPERSSLKPLRGASRSIRKRLDIVGELQLAAGPTALVLMVLALVEVLTQQRLLFASLASSAFLIYLDPQHGTNTIRTLVSSQLMAATVGLGTFLLLGDGYFSGATAMVTTIVLMIVGDVVHPPAVSTALSFALRTGDVSNLALFALAVGMTAALVGVERVALWLLARHSRRQARSKGQ